MSEPVLPELSEVSTPVLVLDLDVLDANIATVARTCADAGVRWRPHVKAVRSPELARRLLDAGAVGVTCATVAEATTMDAAGITGILVGNQVVGRPALARLTALGGRCSVAVDDRVAATELHEAAVAAGQTMGVLIEVDIGLARAGVRPGEPVLALARHVADLPGLRLDGLMAWEGHAVTLSEDGTKRDAVRSAVAQLVASADLCRSHEIPIAVVSCGGTGTLRWSAQEPGVTEVQAGGGVIGDVRYRTRMGVELPRALSVLSTVTSRPTPTRVVTDAGFKAMSREGADPVALDLETRTVRLSAEHAMLELERPSPTPCVGDRVRFLVGHADMTMSQHTRVYALRGAAAPRVIELPPRP